MDGGLELSASGDLMRMHRNEKASLSTSSVGLVFALPIEMAPIRGALKCDPTQLFQGAFHTGTLEGTPVVLAAAGIGFDKAENATKRLLEQFKVKAVLSLGYAGALKEGVKTGELIVVRNVLHGDWKKGLNGLKSYPCHPSLLELCREAAEEGGFKAHLGDLLTVAEPIKRPEDKRQAGLLTGAVAVDMESAAVAVAASQAKTTAGATAFMALKIILDEVSEELKGTELVDEEGRVRLFKTFIYLLCHPLDIIYLIRLNRQTEQANSELARFLPVLFKKLKRRVTGHL